MVNLVGTGGALILLPNASVRGQWIVVAVGVAVSVVPFAFGMMISFRQSLARRAGFATVAVIVPAAVLFGLLAYVVPESAWVFATWAIVLLGYATLAAHRLVRWPTGDLPDERAALGIFISYRRQDSGDTVGRIHDHLRQAFEGEHIFLDADSQAAGADYRMVIARALESTEVVLAVIGTRWTDVTDRAGRRRLLDPGDMVRIELETAFARQLHVVPVLIEGVGMPAPADLPPSLRPLCYRTAMLVRPDPDFQPDMLRLVRALRAFDRNERTVDALSAPKSRASSPQP